MISARDREMNTGTSESGLHDNKNPDFPMIIYIMGTGRSGTTILEVLLGSQDKVVQAGEITHIFKDGIQRSIACACGSLAEKCPLWGSVLFGTHLNITKSSEYRK